jgi:hypothetical protein
MVCDGVCVRTSVVPVRVRRHQQVRRVRSKDFVNVRNHKLSRLRLARRKGIIVDLLVKYRQSDANRRRLRRVCSRQSLERSLHRGDSTCKEARRHRLHQCKRRQTLGSSGPRTAKDASNRKSRAGGRGVRKQNSGVALNSTVPRTNSGRSARSKRRPRWSVLHA